MLFRSGEQLIDNAARVGEHLLKRLRALAESHPAITDVRGEGLMIGIEYAQPIKALRTHLVKEEHVFTGTASTNILRLLPPLCLTIAQADDFIERLERAMAATC